jgi:hypothetical protein
VHDGTPQLVFYGLHLLMCGEVADWFMTRGDAESALAEVLSDEPGRVDQIEVVRVEFGTTVVSVT